MFSQLHQLFSSGVQLFHLGARLRPGNQSFSHTEESSPVNKSMGGAWPCLLSFALCFSVTLRLSGIDTVSSSEELGAHNSFSTVGFLLLKHSSNLLQLHLKCILFSCNVCRSVSRSSASSVSSSLESAPSCSVGSSKSCESSCDC